MRLKLTLLLMVLVAASGCERDNGLPADLVRHLAQQNIQITPFTSHAPLSSRAGYVVIPFEATTVEGIIITYDLDKIDAEDPRWDTALQQAGWDLSVKALWGLDSRPVEFKLSNGGQFEYFYMLVNEDGSVYLLAEYAYG